MRVSKSLAIALAFVIVVSLGIYLFSNAEKRASLTTKQAIIGPGTPTIECTLRNCSLRPIYYGHDFQVERWVDDRWETVKASQNFRYLLSIAMVWPLSSKSIPYPISLYADFSEDGLYRIVQTVWTGEAKNAIKYPLYCEFTVSA